MASRPTGLSLVELLVTVAILSVLALGALPLAELTVQRTKESELRAALRDIRSAIDAYKRAADAGRVARPADTSGYPPSLDVLVQGVTDAKDLGKKRLYFLRRLPRDPMHGQGGDSVPDWGLRSYASPPDEPQAGRDVFDVYSRSAAVGLNGVPYRNW